MLYFYGIFYPFVRVPLFSETSLILTSRNFITLLLNRANCWNFQSDKKNVDMLVLLKKSL